MTTRKKTASETDVTSAKAPVKVTQSVADTPGEKTATPDKTAPTAASEAGSHGGSKAASKAGSDSVTQQEAQGLRSSLDLRVLPSFDPRVKLLVELMGRIDGASVQDHGAGSSDANEVRAQVADRLRDYLPTIKDAGLEVKIVSNGGDVRPKSLQDRIADFMPVAAKIIKGKHPDFIGSPKLDKEALKEGMVAYIDSFYGLLEETPGTHLRAEIGALLDQADGYFDKIIAGQKVNGESGIEQTFGLKNIEAFLATVGD